MLINSTIGKHAYFFEMQYGKGIHLKMFTVSKWKKILLQNNLSRLLPVELFLILRIDPNRKRPVIDQTHFHVGPKFSCKHVFPKFLL